MSLVSFAARSCAALLLCVGSLSAQTTFATITGNVADPGGAIVSGATLVATHVDSNYQYTARSNEGGNYNISQLREGQYVLRVHAAGFKESVIQDIRLVSLDVRRIDVRLELGAVETKVEVSAGATLIETETARISESKGATALKTLPMNTR